MREGIHLPGLGYNDLFCQNPIRARANQLMSENPVQRSLRILIVDDSPEDRAELRRMLLTGSERRYQFSEAGTGAQMLVVCLKNAAGPPDCVFLDYHLPDYDAPE